MINLIYLNLCFFIWIYLLIFMEFDVIIKCVKFDIFFLFFVINRCGLKNMDLIVVELMCDIKL